MEAGREGSVSEDGRNRKCVYFLALTKRLPLGASFNRISARFVQSWQSPLSSFSLDRSSCSSDIKSDGGSSKSRSQYHGRSEEVLDSQLKTDRFPFPSEGDITLKVRNANYTLGPVMLHIVMNPGAVIPAHLHKGMAEALYVAEGDFTNEGKQYQAGTSLHFKAGKAHGPHSTKNGCKLLALWTERSSKEAADLTDFTVEQKAA